MFSGNGVHKLRQYLNSRVLSPLYLPSLHSEHEEDGDESVTAEQEEDIGWVGVAVNGINGDTNGN